MLGNRCFFFTITLNKLFKMKQNQVVLFPAPRLKLLEIHDSSFISNCFLKVPYFWVYATGNEDIWIPRAEEQQREKIHL